MPKKSASLTIDPTSNEVVLAYRGDGVGSARNAPTRDLTHNDIARLVYRESLGEVARDVGQPVDREDPDSPLFAPPDPRAPDQALATAIVDELVASGRFTTDVPEPAPAEPEVPQPAPDAPPAAPAEPEVPQP
jgi:hypothetical protein